MAAAVPGGRARICRARDGKTDVVCLRDSILALEELPDGRVESKADDIAALQVAGYFVVLLFVGLVSVDLSVMRVETRKEQGGHGVPLDKLQARFPRTQVGGWSCRSAGGYDADVRQQPLTPGREDNSRA